MRIANRIASLLLGLALAALGVLVVVEAIGVAAGDSPVLVPWDRWYASLARTRVDDPVVLIAGIAAIVVGLIVLVGQLRRWRPIRLATATDGWYVRRRDLERRLTNRLDGLSGVTGARARLSRRWRVRVAVHADADQAATVEETALTELDRLDAPAERRVTVSTRRPRRVV